MSKQRGEAVPEGSTPLPALWILPVIIVSQFAGGTLWFSGNAILPDLEREWQVGGQLVGLFTSSVQLGFIAGTLFFAWFTVVDRYSARKVFFYCTLLGAAVNMMPVLLRDQLGLLLLARGLTGFFLAGMYPVGMKIASGWYQKGLGKALGYLVGALVLGTAYPHLLRATGYQLDWQAVLFTTSTLSVAGGILMLLLVPDGPYLTTSSLVKGQELWGVFKGKGFRAAAFGYFGLMWELYSLWAFLPLFLMAHPELGERGGGTLSFLVFFIIASGSIGCVIGGHLSKRQGSGRCAYWQLAFSGSCCLLSPLFLAMPGGLFLTLMIFWGITVAGDSPQYSAIIAQQVPKELVGSALTLVTCIGFLLTIVSITCLDILLTWIEVKYLLLFLLPGPLFGLSSLRYFLREDS